MPTQIEGFVEEIGVTLLLLLSTHYSAADKAEGGMGLGDLLSSDWAVTSEASLACCSKR